MKKTNVMVSVKPHCPMAIPTKVNTKMANVTALEHIDFRTQLVMLVSLVLFNLEIVFFSHVLKSNRWICEKQTSRERYFLLSWRIKVWWWLEWKCSWWLRNIYLSEQWCIWRRMEKSSKTWQRNLYLCCYKYELDTRESFFFMFANRMYLEAKYLGTWNTGKRQGPGELQFNQYRYVGKFHENYVRI